VALLLASQAFYLVLSFSALANMHRESGRILDTYIAEHLGRRLDTVAGLGLGLDRYTTLARNVSEAAELSEADFLFVTVREGRLLAGQVPEPLFQPPAGEGNTGVFTFQEEGRLWLGRAVTGPKGEAAAYIFISGRQFDSQGQAWDAFQKRRFAYLAINLLSVLLLVSLTVSLLRQAQASRPVSRGRVLGFLLTPFILAQVGFFAFSLGDIFERHLEGKRAAVGQLARYLAVDLGKISEQGLDLRTITDLGPYLNRLRGQMTDLEILAVFDGSGPPLAGTGSSPGDLARGELLVTHPFRQGAISDGRIEVRLSSSVIGRERLSLILDNLTLTLASGLLFLELARLLMARLGTGAGVAAARPHAPTPAPARPDQIAAMRPLIFLALMALDFSLSFIPLKMLDFKGGFLGLAPKIVCGLPISLEMLMAGLFMLGGGFWARRLGGWRPLFLAGLFTLAGGYFLSGLAPGPGLFIAARGLAGAGYGLLNIAAQIFIITNSPPDRQGEALAGLFASFFAGGLCGCAAGGLLADRFGYDPVFYASAAIFLALAGLTLIGLPSGPRTMVPRNYAPVKSWLVFFRSGPIWRFFLLVVIPGSLAGAGLINYFLPLHLVGLGAGPAQIGQLNALFSLLVIALGPLAGRGLDLSRRPFLFLVLAGLLAALAWPAFLVWPTLAGACAGLVILGLAAAISEGGEPAYLLNRPETKPLGGETALSFYNAIGKLGQALGPLAVAWAWNFRDGLWALSFILFLAALIFWAQAGRAAGPKAA
jgi:predicted MFS family arabinose efflux permease